MRFYIQLGKGSLFSWRNFLLNSFELYLSDLSQRIVTIVFPGPNSFPSFIAPAILTPQLVLNSILHFVLNQKLQAKIHGHLSKSHHLF